MTAPKPCQGVQAVLRSVGAIEALKEGRGVTLKDGSGGRLENGLRVLGGKSEAGRPLLGSRRDGGG